MKNLTVFLICLILFGITLSIMLNTGVTYELEEVENIYCDGVDAIGCSTVYPLNHIVIQYVPENSPSRDYRGYHISINETLNHEYMHLQQYKETGTMWEWE